MIVAVLAFAACGAPAQKLPGLTGKPSAAVELRRMACGKDQPLPKAMFSDTFRYPDESRKDFTFSCYLIRHGDDFKVVSSYTLKFATDGFALAHVGIRSSRKH